MSEIESTEADHSKTQRSVRVEGLAETLHAVRHELDLIGHATKFNWVNQRLILLRNALMALGLLVVVLVVGLACYREAYRQTLTIAAFDVPPSLTQRGITGQVVAKALFDELIKRRDLVTTLDAGELKGAWAENRSDVAIPEAKFTLQALFRYLRHMTGNEIAVDGEIYVNGDDATLKVRVAGKPPTVVKGKADQWDASVGELANGVLEITQPAVLAGYLGAQAKTPQDLVALSKHIIKMRSANIRPSGAVLSVAYDAYGSALHRQGRYSEAQAAFAEAMSQDGRNGVAVINAANTQSALRNYTDASLLYKQAQAMHLPDVVKAAALQRRIAGATIVGDCPSAALAVQDAKASKAYDASASAGIEGLYIARCEYEEARAFALVQRFAQLHPDDAGAINMLGIIQRMRPEGRFREESIKISRAAIAAGAKEVSIYHNLARSLIEKGEYDEALELYDRALPLRIQSGIAPSALMREQIEGTIDYFKRDFAKADAAFRRAYATVPLREEGQFLSFAGVQAGLGRYDEAIKLYTDGLTLLPKSCQLWEAFGAMHAAKGDVPTALATFDQGIQATPKCGLNHNTSARLLIAQNRKPEARQKLEALIKNAPNSDGAVIAKEILAGL